MMAATVPQEHEVAHNFDDLEQEFESQRLGMWLFMASAIMMSGILLAGGVILLYQHPDTFAEGRAHLDWRLGALNAFILLTGGFVMARAADFARKGEQDKARTNLALSLLPACGFLVVKFFEYWLQFRHGLLPGSAFHGEGFTSPYVHVFFGYYFVSTGLQTLHVLIGMSLMIWSLKVSQKVRFTRAYYTPVEFPGMYWTMVILMWIFLFPLLYLVG
jgi:cytochrome c oxidase subunit III